MPPITENERRICLWFDAQSWFGPKLYISRQQRLNRAIRLGRPPPHNLMQTLQRHPSLAQFVPHDRMVGNGYS